MFGEIDSFLSIIDRIRKWWRCKEESGNQKFDSIAARVVALLESHGVHRNQIPRFLGHGLKLVDVETDARLMEKLTDQILDDVSIRFSVQREWLDGATDQIYQVLDFYKQPRVFLEFVKKLKKQNPDRDISGLLLNPAYSLGRNESLIIIQECIGYIGEKPIYRYFLCNYWPFSYWKARAYLTACISIAWKNEIYIHGLKLPANKIDQLAGGRVLLGWKGDGFWELGLSGWDPEDMTLSPEKYLEGVDSEMNNFGIISALRLWLSLDEEGFMDSGFGSNARDLFSEELRKYESG